ncbi:SDR family oxidoreductase [Amycolatopsis samaneae]|uniref:SDR family oxidoreductase n=1 Tax=Amycolatopsis samaneae TaxID=664691 RepID=A0ABW5GWL2_9PSEU
MSEASDRVLVVGATGRTGRHVVPALSERGLTPVALARDEQRAASLLPGTEIVVGDLEDIASLRAALRGIDDIVFVHGSDADSRADSVRRVDYGGVVNVLRALDGAKARLVLQTSIFVTRRDHYFNDGAHALDWKRRSERVVRLSGLPYTVVRPGWLDGGDAGRHVTLEQGDAGEGGIDRAVLGALLAETVRNEASLGKTFEVYSGPGSPTGDWTALFGQAARDSASAADGVKDTDNMPLADEPVDVRADLSALRTD